MEEVPKVAVGIILTVTVELTTGPEHPFNEGVTEYCTEPAVVPVTVSVCAMLDPVPFDAPVTLVAVCVQLKVAPAGVLVKFRAVALPEQIALGPETVKTGVGLTVKLL